MSMNQDKNKEKKKQKNKSAGPIRIQFRPLNKLTEKV